jgi:hypothetical protein
VESRLSGVVNISHLLFADDTFGFYGAKLDHLCDLRALFFCNYNHVPLVFCLCDLGDF